MKETDGIVKAVCISREKGTPKENIGQGLSQIGKECHSGCIIAQTAGKCIMPTEGVFARVIRGGTVKAGDPVKIEYHKTEYK